MRSQAHKLSEAAEFVSLAFVCVSSITFYLDFSPMQSYYSAVFSSLNHSLLTFWTWSLLLSLNPSAVLLSGSLFPTAVAAHHAP